jgi:acetyltransferase
MTDPTETARRLAALRHSSRKPILASWMGDESVVAAKLIFRDVGIPTFEFPDDAARAFCYMWQYSKNIDALYETPARPEETGQGATPSKCVSRLLTASRATGKTILDEVESKRVLEAYGIPTTTAVHAATPDEATEAAIQMGFPVAVKLVSNTITHKTDVRGVLLNLQTGAAVHDAFMSIQQSVAAKFGEGHFNGVSIQPMITSPGYEIILGSTYDPQFGPVLMFGTGGQLVEILGDRVLGLPPLNCTLARRMLVQTKIYRAFKGVRGRKPVDVAQLENLLVRFSQLVLDQPLIKEIEINPLHVSDEQIIALDARIILHSPETDLAVLIEPAIRPYPSQYVRPWELHDRTQVTIRPIRPEDEPMLVKFHESLSEESVRQRYLATMKLSERTAHSRLRRICFSDYDREIVLVAEHLSAPDQREILGIGRLTKGGGRDDAEFAIVVSTPWQGKGLGTELLGRLVKIASDERLSRITGHMFAGNREMIAIARKIGFAVRYDPDGATCTAELALTGDSPAVAPPVSHLSPCDSRGAS